MNKEEEEAHCFIASQIVTGYNKEAGLHGEHVKTSQERLERDATFDDHIGEELSKASHMHLSSVLLGPV